MCAMAGFICETGQFSCRFFQTLEASNKLRQNLQQQHSSLVQFASGVCQRLNDPFQGAALIVQSFPWSPDVLSVINAMAEHDGEPRAAGIFTCTGMKQNRSSVPKTTFVSKLSYVAVLCLFLSMP